MKINKLIITIIAAAFIFMGCSNSMDGNAPANGSYSVSGKISFAGSSGAAPVIFTPDSNGRTATTSFNNEHLSLNLYAYKYDNDGNLLTEKKYDNVVVDQSGSFVFCFEEKGNYKIYAEVLRNGIKCATGMTEVGITGYSSNTINIKTIPLITENGKILLNVSAATDITPQIKKVYVSWLSSFSGFIEDDNNASHGSAEHEAAMEKMNAVTSGKYNKSFDVVNGSATITYNEFPGGNWLAKISFEDETGNSLYSCQEIINVYPGFTTNRWYGSSPALNNGTFKITKNMVTNYDGERVPNTDYVLYNKDENYKYHYYLRNSSSESVNGEADFSTSSSSFSFDANGYFYIYGEEKIYTNNPNFSNNFIGKSSFPDIAGITIEGIVIDVTKNVIYIYSKNEMQLDLYKFSDFISNGSTELSKHYSVNYDAGSYFHEDMVINDGILYDLCSKDLNPCVVTTILGEVTEIHSFAKEVTIDLSEICGDSSTLFINDMLYQDGSIYMLCKGSGSFNSRGAVLRYNTATGYIDSLGLAGAIDNDSFAGVKVSTYVFDDPDNKPLYNDEACTSQWYVDADKAWHSDFYDIDMTLLPSIYSPDSFDSLSTNQFYGPSKFVAVKPKKLVIADDGIAFYADNDVLKYKNINRVVTVDLERFAIENTEDTSVIFDSDKSDMIQIGDTGTTEYQEGFVDAVDSSNKKYYENPSNPDDCPLTDVYGKSVIFGIPCGD